MPASIDSFFSPNMLTVALATCEVFPAYTYKAADAVDTVFCKCITRSSRTIHLTLINICN